MGNVVPMMSEQTEQEWATWENFWILYPRHVARRDAEKAWMKLDTADREAALLALPEMARFRGMYPFTPIAGLMREFGRTRAAIKCMAVKLRLEKAIENSGRFPKGLTPWNAGKPYQAGGRSTETRFKKGGNHPRARPVGSERRDRDGVYVKVAGRRRWIRKERLQWEREHGPVPAGMVVRSDGGTLRLVSRAENVRMNAKIRRPKRKPLAPWIRPLGIAA